MLPKNRKHIDEIKKQLFNGEKRDEFTDEESVNKEKCKKMVCLDSFLRCGDGTWKPLLVTLVILAVGALYKIINIFWHALYVIHLSLLWSRLRNMTDQTANSGLVADFISFLLGLLNFNVLKALILGLAVSIFTWMITYYDSLEPGRWPPTPLSPERYRKLSGHTFHLGYIMAIVNGFVVFALVLWL